MLPATIPATDSNTHTKTKTIRRTRCYEKTARNAGPEWSATRD